MDDLISRQATVDEVQAIEYLATLRDGDVVVRMNDVEHILYTMPSAQLKSCRGCKYEPRCSHEEPCATCSNNYVNKWRSRNA